MKYLKENIFSFVIFLAAVGVSFYFYPQLPASVATKYDFNGNPIQYSSREFVAFFMPVLFFFLIVFVNVMVKASPEKFSMPNSKKAMDIIGAGCGLLFFGIHLGMMIDPGNKASFARYSSMGAALFLVVVGNVFGKTERNFFMGIRIPWTLASEANWRATHRFCGKMMVASGIGLLTITLIQPSVFISILAILVPTLTPMIYSYVYYRKHELDA